VFPANPRAIKTRARLQPFLQHDRRSPERLKEDNATLKDKIGQLKEAFLNVGDLFANKPGLTHFSKRDFTLPVRRNSTRQKVDFREAGGGSCVCSRGGGGRIHGGEEHVGLPLYMGKQTTPLCLRLWEGGKRKKGIWHFPQQKGLSSKK